MLYNIIPKFTKICAKVAKSIKAVTACATLAQAVTAFRRAGRFYLQLQRPTMPSYRPSDGFGW